MKISTQSVPPVPLARLVLDLIGRARDQKRRTRQRLRDMAGDFIAEPSRGPIQRNGRRCIRWHYWQASRSKHQAITDQITAVKSCMPNVTEHPTADAAAGSHTKPTNQNET